MKHIKLKDPPWILLILGVALVFLVSPVFALEVHESCIYPVVRLTQGSSGGSGTVIYSQLNGEKTFSTYVLTNHHVISGAISIEEKWDSDLQKNVKTEKRAIIYVEVFKYRDISIPIGTLKVEAEIVLYDEDQDLALVKFRSEEAIEYVARLHPRHQSYHVMTLTLAVGCSLGFPPVPTPGIVTRKNFQIDSLPYDMSSSQIIYGNSGGGMFRELTRELIGIPSRVAVIGWGSPIPHMGLFIPIERIYDWLDKEQYDFLINELESEKDCINETECLELRKKEIKAKQKSDL